MDADSSVISVIDRGVDLEIRCDSKSPVTLQGLINDRLLAGRFRLGVSGRSFVMRHSHEGMPSQVLDELYKNSWKMGTSSLKAGRDGRMQKTYYLHRPIISMCGDVVDIDDLSVVTGDGSLPVAPPKSTHQTTSMNAASTLLKTISARKPAVPVSPFAVAASPSSSSPSSSAGAAGRTPDLGTNTSASNTNANFVATSGTVGTSGSPMRTAEMLIRDVMSPRSRTNYASGIGGGTSVGSSSTRLESSESSGPTHASPTPRMPSVLTSTLERSRYISAGSTSTVSSSRFDEAMQKNNVGLGNSANIDRLKGIKSSRQIALENMAELERQLLEAKEALAGATEREVAMSAQLAKNEEALADANEQLTQIENRARVHAEEVAQLIWNQRKAQVEEEAKVAAEKYYVQVLKANTQRAQDDAEDLATKLWDDKKAHIIEAAMKKAEATVNERIVFQTKRADDAELAVETLEQELITACAALRDARVNAAREKERAAEELSTVRRSVEDLAEAHANQVVDELWASRQAQLEDRVRSEEDAKYSSMLTDAQRMARAAAESNYDDRLEALQKAHAEELAAVHEAHREDLRGQREEGAGGGGGGRGSVLSVHDAIDEEELQARLEHCEEQVTARLTAEHSAQLASLRQKHAEEMAITDTAAGGSADSSMSMALSSAVDKARGAGSEALEAAMQKYAVEMAEKVWQARKDEVLALATRKISEAGGGVGTGAGTNSELEEALARAAEAEERAAEAEERAVDTAKVHFQEQWAEQSARVREEAHAEAETVMAKIWDEQKKELETAARWRVATEYKETVDELEKRLALAERRVEVGSAATANGDGGGDDLLELTARLSASEAATKAALARAENAELEVDELTNALDEMAMGAQTETQDQFEPAVAAPDNATANTPPPPPSSRDGAELGELVSPPLRSPEVTENDFEFFE